MLNILQTAAQRREGAALDFQAEERRVEAAIKKGQADLEQARLRASHLRASCDEAYAAYTRIELEIGECRRLLDCRRSEYERQMRESAPAEIGDFMDWCEIEQKNLRRALRTSEAQGPIDLRTGRHQMMASSNGAAVQLVAQALIEARQRAAALVYEHTPDLAAALEALRRGIPTLDEAEARTREQVA
jgi:hypothetical protein